MANTSMQSSDGMYSLYTWQYGKYLVAMNASADTDYELWLPEERPTSAIDVITGQNIDLSSNPVVKPQTTLILEWPEDVPVVSVDEETALPLSYELKQNYPNPFNPSTTIEYTIAQPGNVKLEVYNVIGQKVQTLVDDYRMAGKYAFTMNANDLPTGIYFYSLQSGDYKQTRKMMLMQ
jgi:hypothetical protein